MPVQQPSIQENTRVAAEWAGKHCEVWWAEARCPSRPGSLTYEAAAVVSNCTIRSGVSNGAPERLSGILTSYECHSVIWFSTAHKWTQFLHSIILER